MSFDEFQNSARLYVIGALEPDELQNFEAARKQGFSSLSEVSQCVLEPGGTLTFVGKKPAAEEVRHHELLGKVESLAHEIALLRGSWPPARA